MNVSVVVPTRGRPAYLEVTLGSLAAQAQEAGAQLLVVSDGPDGDAADVARRHGADYFSLPEPRGLNAARNAAVPATDGELIAFVDDDVEVPAGWLRALLEGVQDAPEHGVFGGPIRARLEGGGPRRCGREPPPITTLDLGDEDHDAALVWGANMAIRRSTLAQVGPFDESIFVRGDEEEWQRRYLAQGGRIRYVAQAGLVHRRTAADAKLRRLARAAYGHGRAARRFDARKGTPPALRAELRVLAGCAWHTVRRRCTFGIVFGAQSAGRLREAVAPQTAGRPPLPGAPDFLSGTSGQVVGKRLTTRALLADGVDDLLRWIRLEPVRLRRAARRLPARRVLALAVEREGIPNVLAAARSELLRSHHQVEFASRSAGVQGKFENLNALLAEHPVAGYDWLLVVDDDVVLPSGFLDGFVFLAERFGFELAQPAHRSRSYAAWKVTRRRRVAVARETVFVEIGPVFAFHAPTFGTLLPFPSLRAGWGLDLHWSALASEHGWPMGVIDATAIRHDLRPIAASYDRTAAIDEATAFLAERPYTPGREAQQILGTHRTWRR